MVPVKNIRSQKSDGELLSEFTLRDNKEALGILYERYMDLVYGVCLKYLGNRDEAKDAVMNIFEELVQKLSRYEIANFRSWLYQVAKNHCLMKIRSNKKLPPVISADIVHLEENFHPEEVLEKEMKLNDMEFCMEKLPAEQKQAIQLFYLEEKCYKDVAAITRLDTNKVRSHIQNGRRNLKICMEKQATAKAK